MHWPCFYGIDFATRAELIATGLGVEEIRASIGADSLGYISLEGMIEATEQPTERLCTACFTGDYPVPLPEDGRVGKHLFETLPMDLSHSTRDIDPEPERISVGRVDVEGVSLGVAGGAENALRHP